jgi:O-antigen/teichoic acid export membrane protein
VTTTQSPAAGFAAPNRSLAVELTGTAITSGVIMAAGVVTGLLSARALGPGGRGELTTVTIWAATALYAGSFGLAEATAYFAGARRDSASSVLVTAQVLALAIAVPLMVVAWLALPWVLNQQTAAVRTEARLYALFFLAPGLSSLCASSWLQGTGRVMELNIARAAVHVVSALLIGILTLTGIASVRLFLAAMLAGNLATWLIALRASYVRRDASLHGWQPELVRPMLSYGSKVQFGTWSAAANVRLDQLMLSTFAVSASLGLYVVGVSYATLVATLPTIAGIVMLPRLIRDCAIGDGGRTLASWYRRVFWLTLGMGCVLWAAASYTLPVLFGSDFTGSVSLQILLIPAACILGMNQLLATGFRGHGQPGIASRGEVVGLLVTVPLLAALLPRYGIYGAAITSLCAYTAVSAYLLFKTRDIVPNLSDLWLPTAEDWLVAKHAARLVVATAFGR